MTTSDQHTLTAMIAVLDHAATHQLPAPVEVHRPGHYLGAASPDDATVGVDLGRVTLEVLDRWEETLTEGFTYTSEATTALAGPAYTRHLYVGQLPTGVRVTIVARTPLEQPTLTSVKPSATPRVDALTGLIQRVHGEG